MRAASTGRTHGSTRPRRIDVHLSPAKWELSTHEDYVDIRASLDTGITSDRKWLVRVAASTLVINAK